MLNSILLKKAVISLMLARIFYTVNWFNIPSIFFFIAVDFDKDISVLGLITASFFIGVGLFQVLAGILASKYSYKEKAIKISQELDDLKEEINNFGKLKKDLDKILKAKNFAKIKGIYLMPPFSKEKYDIAIQVLNVLDPDNGF